MIAIKQVKLAVLAPLSFTLIPCVAGSVTPVLDGYAYELSSDVIIDLEDQIITIDSNMENCEQPNGDPPIDTSLYALNNNSEFIGILQFSYNTTTGTMFFTSETGNLVCANGVYVDTLFANGFE